MFLNSKPFTHQKNNMAKFSDRGVHRRADIPQDIAINYSSCYIPLFSAIDYFSRDVKINLPFCRQMTVTDTPPFEIRLTNVQVSEFTRVRQSGVSSGTTLETLFGEGIINICSEVELAMHLPFKTGGSYCSRLRALANNMDTYAQENAPRTDVSKYVQSIKEVVQFREQRLFGKQYANIKISGGIVE